MAFNASLLADELMAEYFGGPKLEYSFEDLSTEEVQSIISELERQSVAYFTMDEEKEALDSLIQRLRGATM